jgi:uncharacterized protein
VRPLLTPPMVVSLAVLLAVTAPAAAAPVGPGAAVAPYKDPLAGSGKLAVSACPEPLMIHGGMPRSREYLTAMVKCLDKSWSGHLTGARLTYRRPIVRFYDEPADRVCGVDWPTGAAAFYCTERATLVFPLTGRWIEERTDLYPLKVAAHEYGHHVQSLTGIRKHYETRRGDESNRRYELQADCLSGVFLGSVWRSLKRTGDDWTALLDATRASGDYGDERRSHGKGANRVAWFERGFHARSPGACDTWSAPPAKVA